MNDDGSIYISDSTTNQIYKFAPFLPPTSIESEVVDDSVEVTPEITAEVELTEEIEMTEEVEARG